MFKGSWKTTAFGICSILVAAWTFIGSPLLDADPNTVANFTGFAAAAAAAGGLLFARDDKKSSEDVGAK